MRPVAAETKPLCVGTARGGIGLRVLNLGNRIANMYLLELARGWLLIDTGYPRQFKSFAKNLAAHGIHMDDIKYIFLTHAHDDHAGFLNEFLGQSRAEVILSEKAVEGLRRGQNNFEGGCTSKTALRFCNLMGLLGHAEHRFPPVDRTHESRYICVRDGTQPEIEQELGGRIVHTPGHTACSISLLLDDGRLFCGDAAMNGFPSSRRITIWAEDAGEYASSWRKIISLQPAAIYPGHGNPFPVSDLERFLPSAESMSLLPLKRPGSP
ncbi:MAG: MBL fold metallo-hydrolase [Bacillota bacterium]